MKKRYWLVILVAFAAGASSRGLAQSPIGSEDVQALLQKQVEIHERVMDQVRQQFEAGMVPAREVAAVEQQVLESRMALAREQQRGEPNSLQRPIPSIELEAMRLGDVSRTLRELLDERVNFVLKDSAAELSVPALNLRGTDLLTLLNILGDIVPDLGIKVTVGSHVVPISPASPATGMMGGQFGMGMADPFGGQTDRPIGLSENATVIFERTNLTPPPPRVTLTLYLGELLDEMDLDDICMSLETAWDLNRGFSEPILRFHEDTELLIVAGDSTHILVAKEVINQLDERRDSIRNQTKVDFQARFKELEIDLKERYDAKNETLSSAFEKEREAIGLRLEEANRRSEEIEALWRKDRDSSAHERAELAEELKATKRDYVIERTRLLEKMENKLEMTRDQAFLERRELLEQIDELKRMLDSERQRTLDPAEDEGDPRS